MPAVAERLCLEGMGESDRGRAQVNPQLCQEEESLREKPDQLRGQPVLAVRHTHREREYEKTMKLIYDQHPRDMQGEKNTKRQ